MLTDRPLTVTPTCERAAAADEGEDPFATFPVTVATPFATDSDPRSTSGETTCPPFGADCELGGYVSAQSGQGPGLPPAVAAELTTARTSEASVRVPSSARRSDFICGLLFD